MATPNDFPFTFSLKTANDRIRILYPNTEDQHDTIEAFTPPQAEPNITSAGSDPEAMGEEVTAFTPEMANKADGVTRVNGKSIRPGETPYQPSSALEPEHPGYDEAANPTADTAAPSHTDSVNAEVESIREGFPDKPRPNVKSHENQESQ